MSFGGDASARPPRVSFTNLKTGETKEMPFTPEEFEEGVNPNWVSQIILGMSHETLQFSNVGNWAIRGIEFFCRGTSADEIEGIADVRRFIMSLCLPSVADSVREGAPPRVLFFWPQLISMTCILKNLRIRHRKFNTDGRPTVFVIVLDIEEIRDVRLSSEEVRISGTQRNPTAAERTGGGEGDAAS